MDGNTTQLSLIRDETSQLREGPGVECCALRPFSLHPRANVPQIFQRNRPLRAFGLRNNPFGETVVDVLGKPALLASQLPKSAAAAERTELLQLVSQSPVSIAYVLDRRTRVDFSVAIGCDVRDSQIDTERAISLNHFWCFDFAARKQIPVPADKCQIGFATLMFEQSALVLATHKRDGLPPVHCPDRNKRVRQSI